MNYNSAGDVNLPPSTFSLAVQGTLNISLVSHRIIKITDKKVPLSLLAANTK